MSAINETAPIVLAAGGTGGHIFPAEALAETLLKRGERVVLVTDDRFAQFATGALAQVEKRALRMRMPHGKWHQKLLGIAGLGVGVLRARSILRELKPRAVVGFGGYPSFPAAYAASMLDIPVIIHEQNSVLGRANRLLAPRASRIATSFLATRMLDAGDAGKVRLTGNPVRASVQALRHVPYAHLAEGGKLHLLVTGGSQGASVFSQVVPQALALLPTAMRKRIRVDQQCRAGDLEAARQAYEECGVDAHLSAFFVDLPARLAGCHLVIARSGASTVAELAVAGRPAILVPYPQAMDNHQYSNADAFAEAGGGWVMAQEGFTPSSLSARIEALMNAPQSLAKAAACARAAGTPDAAEKLAALVLAEGSGLTPLTETVPLFDTEFSPALAREVAA